MKTSIWQWFTAGCPDLHEYMAKVEGDAPKTPKPRIPRILKPKKAPEENLVGIHNLTANNLQHAHELGGLIAPSLAITHHNHPLEGFGEISLVAHHHLVDPKHTPVFDADVYSPRHPRAKYKVNDTTLSRFRKEMEPHAKQVDAYFGDADNDVNKEGQDAFLNNYKRRRALGLAFLAQKGVKVEPAVKEKKHPWMQMPAMQEFKKKHGIQHYPDSDGEYYKAFEEAADKAADQYMPKHIENLKSAGIEHDQEDLASDKEGMLGRWGDRRFANQPFSNYMKELESEGATEHDPYAYGEKVDQELKNHPDFEPWARAKTQPIVGERYLPKYFDTSNGPSERKLPYTPDNILKEMTRTIRQGESFNYGLGSARSLGAKRFKDVDQMKAARGQIVSKEEFGKHKDAMDTRFGHLADELQRYHPNGGGFGTLGAAAEAIGESYRRGKPLYAALRESGFQNVPPELQQKVAEFAKDLVKSPTEYFEAKPQRVVGLNEFKGAAVPEDASPETHEILKHHGINHIETYDKNAPEGRGEAIRRIAAAHKLLLSERTTAAKPLKPKAPRYEKIRKTEDDEVHRMLAHQSPAERTMALKLTGVKADHLIRALKDPDHAVQHVALHHPAVDGSVLSALMKMPDRHALHLLALNHFQMDPSHLSALYQTSKKKAPEAQQEALRAIAHHGLLDSDLIGKMIHEGHGGLVAAHTAAPGAALDHLVKEHLKDPQDLDKRALARIAVQHVSTDPKLAEQAFKESPLDVKLAVAHGPHLPEAAAHDVMVRGALPSNRHEALLRMAIVMHPRASDRHKQAGQRDPNTLVQAAASNPFEKHENNLHEWMGKQVLSKAFKAPEPLVKGLTINHKEEQGIVDAMLGYHHGFQNTLDAARFLGGGIGTSESRVRNALWENDGAHEIAALRAHGLDPTAENLKALRAVRDMASTKREQQDVDPVDPMKVEPGNQDAAEAADEVRRSFDDRFVMPVALGGKHSKGTMLARDHDTGHVWMLKPGSGGQSPAAGAKEDAASQSRREAAFYHLASAWGMADYYPEAQLLLIDGKEYAAMRLLPWTYKTMDKLKDADPGVPRNILDKYLRTGVVHRWAVVDFVLGNPDRHAGNLMVKGDDVKLIDHGSAMSGEGFDPAHDRYSFTPYYLRAWTDGRFAALAPWAKLKAMPRVGREVTDGLRQWVEQLNEQDLTRVLTAYGVNPQPAVERLSKLKMMVATMPADEAVNKVWVET